MDPINIFFGLALFVSLAANFSGSKKGMKAKVVNVAKRPGTFLQKWPLHIAAIIVFLEILGVFQIGTFQFPDPDKYNFIRIAGLVIFIIFAWLQTKSFKDLGEFYTPEIAVFKSHKLIKSGFYKYIRHPQYACQLLSDFGAGLALMSYLVLPLVLFILLPLFIMRAKYEDNLLKGEFNEEWEEYKKNTGLLFPFLG